MKSTETAWSKGFKPRDVSRTTQNNTEISSPTSNVVRKSYAAASAVTLPQKTSSMKNTQRLTSILGKPGSNRYTKSHDRGNRRVRQRSAFSNVDREEREKERQVRKEKYSKIQKQRYTLDELLQARKSQQLIKLSIEEEQSFEGLQLHEPLLPVLEEKFDSKQYTAEWYEALKKERAEKMKRYSEREKARKLSLDKSPNPWRSPPWNDEKPSVSPEALDLEKISKITERMSTSLKNNEEESFELADMAEKAKRFEEENRYKHKEKKGEMPSFFNQAQNENEGLKDVLNSALEDCTRPPEEEIIPKHEGIVFHELKADEEEEKLRLKDDAWKREKAQAEAEYFRQQEEAIRMKKQREYEEMMQREHISRERERQRHLHLQRQQQQHQISFLPSEWFYRDPQGCVQGPYNSQTMRTWLERKFFKDDLPIAENSPQNRFLPIRQVFPDPRTAFLDIYRRQEYPRPQHQPPPNYFSSIAFGEPAQRMSEYDLQRLRAQSPVVQPKENDFQSSSLNKTGGSDFDDFLDLNSDFKTNSRVETNEDNKKPEISSELQETPSPVVSKQAELQREEQKKKVTQKPKKQTKSKENLPAKLEGLSDNLKKMLGVSNKKKEIPSTVEPQQQPKGNPWKKTEKQQSSSVSLRQIQEEEQQKSKQDLINGTYQPNQSKVWANLVAKNASGFQKTKNTQSSAVKPNSTSEKLIRGRKKFLGWYRNACNVNNFGFDERVCDMGIAMEKPAELRNLFKDHFGDSQKSLKFATEFLNMKDKFLA